MMLKLSGLVCIFAAACLVAWLAKTQSKGGIERQERLSEISSCWKEHSTMTGHPRWLQEGRCMGLERTFKARYIPHL